MSVPQEQVIKHHHNLTLSEDKLHPYSSDDKENTVAIRVDQDRQTHDCSSMSCLHCH